MLDQRSCDAILDDVAIDQTILSLLLEDDRRPLWAVEEVVRELGDRLATEDGLDRLHNAGVIHRFKASCASSGSRSTARGSADHGNTRSPFLSGLNERIPCMERETLVRYLEDGLSLERMGELAGKHPSTIGYWLQKHGLVAAKRDKHVAKGGIDRSALEPLVELGLSHAAIAQRLEVPASRVRYWLDRYELETARTRVRRANSECGGARGEIIERLCRWHGATAFKLRRDGAYRCMRCAAESVARRRRRVKEILVAEAGGACRICGYNRHPAALEFHHLNPAEKEFTLSNQGVTRSLERARAEARKCVLLCATCHAEVEQGVAVVSLS